MLDKNVCRAMSDDEKIAAGYDELFQKAVA
jgi:hypothetical protein